MNRKKTLFLLGSLALAVGCGGDGEPIEPNVEDGATRVSILTVFEATTSYDLDVTSVTSETVRMVDEKGFQVAAEVSYDEAARMIRLRPIRPLDYDETYRWEIAGVQARSGQVFDSVTVEFKTYINPIKRRIYYTYVDGSQEISFYAQHAREGEQGVGYDHYGSPGADGQWFTEDDEVFNYVRNTFDATGRIHRAIHYWADDSVHSYWENMYDANGNVEKQVYYESAGYDGEWFNGDDDLVEAYVYRYLDNGLLEASSRYGSPGLDEVWLNDDDVRESYTLRVYDEKGWQTRLLSFTDAGQDGVWETNDDTLGSYHDIVHDHRGLLIERSGYGAPGQDGEWFTADDQQNLFSSRTYDPDGNRIEEVAMKGAGPDGQWGTADDEVAFRFESYPGI